MDDLYHTAGNGSHTGKVPVKDIADLMEKLAGILIDQSAIEVVRKRVEGISGKLTPDRVHPTNFIRDLIQPARAANEPYLYSTIQDILDDPTRYTNDQIRFFVATAILAARDYNFLGNLSESANKVNEPIGTVESDKSIEEEGFREQALLKRMQAERDRINKEFAEGGDLSSWMHELSTLAIGIQSINITDRYIGIHSERDTKDIDPPIEPEMLYKRAKLIADFLDEFAQELKLEEAKEAAKPLIETIRTRFSILQDPTFIEITDIAGNEPPGRSVGE